MSPALAVNGEEVRQLPQTLKKGVTETEVLPVAINDEPLTIDAFMRLRAIQNPTNPVLSYPSQGTDYVDYSMQQLDVFAFRAAQTYQRMIPSRRSSQEKPAVVALLGPSDLSYVITMLALTKLGHSILFLSTQISDQAYKSLLETTGSVHMIVHPRYQAMAEAILAMKSDLQVLPIMDRSSYDFPVEAYGDTRLDRHLDPQVEKDNVCFIIHSSGMIAVSIFLKH
jgi:acyl-CoA synthetase (AMP-forming)/AMP-acid ligase II